MGGTIEPFEWSDNSRPVSCSQREMWTLDTAVQGCALGNPAYNVSVAFQITGEIDTKTLIAAFTMVAQRHEVLRSRFAVDGTGALRAVIKANNVYRVEMRQEFSVSDIDAAVRAEAAAPFTIEEGPLLRVALLHDTKNSLAHRATSKAVLVVTMHHIVCDEWSCGLLFKELSEVYIAMKLKREPVLPNLPIQYADVSLYQESPQYHTKVQGALRRWKARLQYAPAYITLPMDRPRPGTPTFAGDSVRLAMEEQLEQQLRGVASKLRVNMNALYLTAFKVMPSFYCFFF